MLTRHICVVTILIAGSEATYASWSVRVLERVEHAGDSEFTTQPHPSLPPQRIESPRHGEIDQMKLADALLAWVESLRQKHELITLNDRRLVLHVVRVFGELRYTRGVPFLIDEAFGPSDKVVGFYNPKIHPDSIETPPFEETHPHLVALAKIGSPAVVPLVEEYVRVWKQDRKGNHVLLLTIEIALGYDSIRPAALILIEWRLARSSASGIDPVMHEALQHLKQVLVKRGM